jgi:hypothetical protein
VTGLMLASALFQAVGVVLGALSRITTRLSHSLKGRGSSRCIGTTRQVCCVWSSPICADRKTNAWGGSARAGLRGLPWDAGPGDEQ